MDINEIRMDFDKILFPATIIHDSIAGKFCSKDRFSKIWIRKIICVLSSCKFAESILKRFFPNLEATARNYLKDIYGTWFIHLDYPHRIMNYLAAENNKVNNKLPIESRQMGEILAFEKYIIWS